MTARTPRGAARRDGRTPDAIAIGDLYVTREAAADWRRSPRHSAELVSQSILGEVVRALRKREDWIFVEALNGYRGWVRSWALASLAAEPDAARFLEGPHARVTAAYAPLLAAPSARARRICEAGFLARLPYLGQRGAYFCVLLPGRGPAWVARAAAELPRRTARAIPPARLIAMSARLAGAPYVWGGTSSRGYDCSGLVMRLFEWAGVQLPRDARDQASRGYDFAKPSLAAPGDLLFFGARGRAVSHVAIALGGGSILHASRSSVRIESLRERADLPRIFRGGQRYPAPPSSSSRTRDRALRGRAS
ncbi:MAG: NlpC/P60 family protein [bacterium]